MLFRVQTPHSRPECLTVWELHDGAQGSKHPLLGHIGHCQCCIICRDGSVGHAAGILLLLMLLAHMYSSLGRTLDGTTAPKMHQSGSGSVRQGEARRARTGILVWGLPSAFASCSFICAACWA